MFSLNQRILIPRMKHLHCGINSGQSADSLGYFRSIVLRSSSMGLVAATDASSPLIGTVFLSFEPILQVRTEVKSCPRTWFPALYASVLLVIVEYHSDRSLILCDAIMAFDIAHWVHLHILFESGGNHQKILYLVFLMLRTPVELAAKAVF